MTAPLPFPCGYSICTPCVHVPHNPNELSSAHSFKHPVMAVWTLASSQHYTCSNWYAFCCSSGLTLFHTLCEVCTCTCSSAMHTLSIKAPSGDRSAASELMTNLRTFMLSIELEKICWDGSTNSRIKPSLISHEIGKTRWHRTHKQHCNAL